MHIQYHSINVKLFSIITQRRIYRSKTNVLIYFNPLLNMSWISKVIRHQGFSLFYLMGSLLHPHHHRHLHLQLSSFHNSKKPTMKILNVKMSAILNDFLPVIFWSEVFRWTIPLWKYAFCLFLILIFHFIKNFTSWN